MRSQPSASSLPIAVFLTTKDEDGEIYQNGEWGPFPAEMETQTCIFLIDQNRQIL